MSLDKEDIIELQGILDDRYVLQRDCDDTQKGVSNKFANDDKRLELVTKDIDLFKKLAWLLVTATTGQLVVMLFDLVKGF